MDKTLVFVRHGESEGNIVPPGHPDWYAKPNPEFSLTDNGRAQIARTATWLKTLFPAGFDHCVVSTFLRTAQTMAILAPGQTPRIDSRLDEKWDGIWHTLRNRQIKKYHPLEFEIRDRLGWYYYRAPGGQNCPDVEARIYSFLTDLEHDSHGPNILIAAHGNWLHLLWRILQNRSVAEVAAKRKTAHYQNGSVTIYHLHDGQFVLTRDNELPPT